MERRRSTATPPCAAVVGVGGFQAGGPHRLAGGRSGIVGPMIHATRPWNGVASGYVEIEYAA